MTHTHAVVLLSGGLDSATCLALADDEYDTVQPVHINYGQQTNEIEHDRARRLAESFETEPLRVVEYADVVRHFAGGVASERDTFLTDDGELSTDDGRSTGYVPMRNLHLIATASGIADVEGADAVFIGVQGGDEETYPDCRPAFIEAVGLAVNASLADDDTIEIRAPLLERSKTDVIRLADDLGVPFELTYSCYAETSFDDPDPCTECPACVERIEAFSDAGISDPVMDQ